jgi:antitoxin ParD1/3/4
MPTRNVNLTDHLDRFVEESIEAGRYQNASEVMREALRLLERRQQEYDLRIRRLEEAIRVGEEAYQRGEYVELDVRELGEFLERLDEQALGVQED